VSTNPEKRFFKHNEPFILRRFNEENKKAQYAVFQPGMKLSGDYLQKYSFGFPTKAKNANVAIFTKENYNVSPNLHVSQGDEYS
jgi:hypothetical protein